MGKVFRPGKSNDAGRIRFVGILVLSVAALLLGSTSVAGANGTESNISITQTDDAVQGNCDPLRAGLTYSRHDTDDYFELVVKAQNPPCDPIDVNAAIYRMPGNGVAWPQTLVEVVPFRISKAGTTTVRFAKGCDPVQFDVIAGETPTEIAPWGTWHGPLLFPFDTDTSYQYWGRDCDGTTTTTEPAETTTTLSDTDTSVPVTVEDTDEDRDPDDSADTEVSPDSDERDSNSSDEGQLAYTGSDTTGPLYIGMAMTIAGIVLLFASRRRHDEDTVQS